MTANQDIGIVGLGAMGLGMAQSLRRAGYRVHACDVRPEAARGFAAEGGVACATPAEAAAAGEVLISAVVNAAQTEAVLFGEGGAAAALRPGSVFVMCSTVDPTVSIAFESRLAEKGILYIDAPISGGVGGLVLANNPPDAGLAQIVEGSSFELGGYINYPLLRTMKITYAMAQGKVYLTGKTPAPTATAAK